jgi:pimeloyl-ACP methyl ester carboxylesterase
MSATARGGVILGIMVRAPVAALLLVASFAFTEPAEDSLSRWVTIGGMKIHYLEAGNATGDGPVLLMIHGWCGSSEDYRPLMLSLPADVRSIAVDLPGCGLSAKPDITYDLPFFLRFLEDLINTLGLDRFVLVGHSMGGQISIHFTAQWPEKVEKLVLIDPYGLEGEEGPWRVLASLGPLVELGFYLNNRLFIEWAIRANVVYKGTPAMVHAIVESTARGILGREGARSTARITRAMIGKGAVNDLLPGIRQESLVIWGDHDRMLAPRWAEQFVSRLPDARSHVIVDTGHMPMVEKPVEVADLLVSFLAR